MQKGVEAELKRFLEEEADHLDYLQTGGTGYPILTVHLPTSVMPLMTITESLERDLNQDFFSSDNAVQKISKKTMKKRSFNNYSATKFKARTF